MKNETDMHRHLFVLHRHAPLAGHKPNPGRWHVHMWWQHSHATVVGKLNRALCRAEHAEETIARLESEIETLGHELDLHDETIGAVRAWSTDEIRIATGSVTYGPTRVEDYEQGYATAQSDVEALVAPSTKRSLAGGPR